MWAAIKQFFGGEPDATPSDGRPPPRDENRPLTHDEATEELSIVRAQLATVRLEVGAVVDNIIAMAGQEREMLLQREQVLMECHDAYLHPQLDMLPGPSTKPLNEGDPVATDDDALDNESSSADDEADPTKTSSAAFAAGNAALTASDLPRLRDQHRIRMARHRRRRMREEGIIPTPSSRPQTDDVIRALHDSLVSRRESLGSTFEGVLRSLRTKRDRLDDTVFRLELLMTRLEVDERHLSRSVGEMERGEWRADMKDDVDARRRRKALQERRRVAASTEAMAMSPDARAAAPDAADATPARHHPQPEQSPAPIIVVRRDNGAVPLEAEMSDREEDTTSDGSDSECSASNGRGAAGDPSPAAAAAHHA